MTKSSKEKYDEYNLTFHYIILDIVTRRDTTGVLKSVFVPHFCCSKLSMFGYWDARNNCKEILKLRQADRKTVFRNWVYLIYLCALNREPELWIALGNIVDKHWLPSPSAPVLPVVPRCQQQQKTVVLPSRPLVQCEYMVADKNACTVFQCFPRETKAKEQSWTSLDCCPLSFILKTHSSGTRRVIYTPAVGLGELDSQIPCVRAGSQPLLLSYLWGLSHSAPWLNILPWGWACLRI